jgi:hypothetical protein
MEMGPPDVRISDIPRELLKSYISEHSYITRTLMEELSDAVKFRMGDDIDPGIYIEMFLSRENPLGAYVRQRHFYDLMAEESGPEDVTAGDKEPGRFSELEAGRLEASGRIEALKDPKSYLQDLRETAETLADLRLMEGFLKQAVMEEEYEYAAELREEISEARLKLGVRKQAEAGEGA